MLHITLPADWRPERCWIADVVLKEFLGLEYQLAFDRGEKLVRIRTAGKTLAISDAFFAGETRTKGALRHWTVVSDALNAKLCTPSIPVLFGRPGFKISSNGDAVLSLDVFGSAFFMLSRYEESVRPERDLHDRFPAHLSLAAQGDFLDRPLVDEYVEVLWSAMSQLWPGLARKRHIARKLVSCDVDLPFDPACASLYRLGKRVVGRVYRERSINALTACINNYQEVQRGNQMHDPYWHALYWIMDVNERAGNQVTFNVIPESTDSVRDAAPHLDDHRMRSLLRTIHARGHLIGIHPGYNTYRNPELFSRSVTILRRALIQERISQDELGGRQHYLRWDVRKTPQLWAENKLTYDSTLTYPTSAGFRTGTCHEYTMFDLAGRKPLTIKQRPLVVMENAVIEKTSAGSAHHECALSSMQHYKRICSRFDGDFTLLWHNSSFLHDANRTMYVDLIQ